MHQPFGRLAEASLYLCTDARRERGDLADFADAALAGGVDIIQLRDKGSPGEQRFGPLEARAELAALEVLADAARRHGALLAVNDRADIARAAGADVLHLGQDDLPLAIARDIIGPRPLIGRSTHDPAQVAAAVAEAARMALTTSASARAGPPRPSRAGPRPAWTCVRAAAELTQRQALVRDRRHRRASGCPRCSPPGPAASWWCGRSPAADDPRAAAQQLKAALTGDG